MSWWREVPAGHDRGSPPGKLTDADRELFRAHWREIAEAVGVTEIETPGGTGYRRARCPKHGGDSFGVSDDGGWICRGECDKGGGDAVSLVEWVRGCDFAAARDFCRGIVGTAGATSTRSKTAKAKQPKPEKLAFAADDLPPELTQKGLTFVERWVYRDADSRPVMIANRMLQPDSAKTFRPQFFDSAKWVLGAPDAGRVLYRLPELLADKTKAVLVLEGEKTTEAAAKLPHGMTCTTWLGGAGAARKADWSSCKGRPVVVFSDHDKAGAKAAVDAARMTTAAGASDVRLVVIPEAEAAKLPEGWDVDDLSKPPTDPMHAAGVDARDVLRWIADAQPFVDTAPADDDVSPFELRDDGLYAEIKRGRVTEWEKIAAPIRLAKIARNAAGGDSTVIAEATDRDGKSRLLPIPHADLVADPRDVWRRLAAAGVWLSSDPAHQRQLVEYLNQQGDDVPRALAVSKTGWHEDTGRWSFLFPDAAYRDGKLDEAVALTARDSVGAFNVAGTLEDWQREIAEPITGNTRPMFAVCLALAGPLLNPCNVKGGGVHLVAPSSRGKTTVLEVAGSVWGGGGADRRFVRSWRATANSLENTAEGHSDTFLALDEISECDPKSVGASIYMLANGYGKSRSRADSTAQRTRSWLLVFLSSGETAPADLMRVTSAVNKVEQHERGGQAVRLITLPAVVSDELGVFDVIPAAEQTSKAAAAFSDVLRTSAATFYGTAGRAFVVALTRDRDGIATRARAHRDYFVKWLVPTDTTPEVRRVGEFFGIAYAAGMIARELSIVPWSDRDIYEAVGHCFQDWKVERGDVTRSTDVEQGIGALRRWFQQKAELHMQGGLNVSPPRERHGYWNGEERAEARLFPESFKEIVGPAWADVAHEMTRRGWLERDKDAAGKLTRHLAKQCRVGTARGRFFVVNASFYNPDPDEDPDGE